MLQFSFPPALISCQALVSSSSSSQALHQVILAEGDCLQQAPFCLPGWTQQTHTHAWWLRCSPGHEQGRPGGAGRGRSHTLSVGTLGEHISDAWVFSQPSAWSLQLGSQAPPGGWQAGGIALLGCRGCVVWDPVHFCHEQGGSTQTAEQYLLLWHWGLSHVQEPGSPEPEQASEGCIFLCCAHFFECVYWEGSVRHFTAPVIWSGKSGRVSPSEMGVLRPVYNKPCLPDVLLFSKGTKTDQPSNKHAYFCRLLRERIYLLVP